MKKAMVFFSLFCAFAFVAGQVQAQNLAEIFVLEEVLSPPTDNLDVTTLAELPDGSLLVGGGFSFLRQPGSSDFQPFQVGENFPAVTATAGGFISTYSPTVEVLHYRWDGRLEHRFPIAKSRIPAMPNTSPIVSTIESFGSGNRNWVGFLRDTMIVNGKRFSDVPGIPTPVKCSELSPMPQGNNCEVLDFLGYRISVFDIEVLDSPKPDNYVFVLATRSGLVRIGYDLSLGQITGFNSAIMPGHEFRAVTSIRNYVYAGRLTDQKGDLSGILLKIEDDTVIDSLSSPLGITGLNDISTMAPVKLFGEQYALLAGTYGQGVFIVNPDSMTLTSTEKLPGVSGFVYDIEIGKPNIYIVTRRNKVARFSIKTNETAVRNPGRAPDEFGFARNYPNPFNPETTIVFGLPKATRVTLRVYNLLGQEARALLVNERLEAGRQSIRWDGRDNAGAPLPSQIYMYRLATGEFVATGKMILMR